MGTDKRAPERQTGRSVQLQDASAGGPEEGCRALFIQQRDAGGSKGDGASLLEARRNLLRKKRAWKPERCGHAEKSARSLGNVQGFPEQFWSPGRPLGQSANVKGASVPRFSMHSWSHFKSVVHCRDARPVNNDTTSDSGALAGYQTARSRRVQPGHTPSSSGGGSVGAP